MELIITGIIWILCIVLIAVETTKIRILILVIQVTLLILQCIYIHKKDKERRWERCLKQKENYSTSKQK